MSEPQPGELKRQGVMRMTGLESSGDFSPHMSSTLDRDDSKSVLECVQEPEQPHIVSACGLDFSKTVAAY